MAENTENLILETARNHFVQNGFAATRMQDIADEAGINKAMLHYYFRSKEKLYQKIVGDILDHTLPKFAKAFQMKAEFWVRVENIIETYVNTLMNNPEIPIFIMSELSQERERFVGEIKKRDSLFPAIQDFILQMNEEMETGRINKVPPLQLLLTILGMTVFPFMAKPIFRTVFDFAEPEFKNLMDDRKAFILSFLKAALTNK